MTTHSWGEATWGQLGLGSDKGIYVSLPRKIQFPPDACNFIGFPVNIANSLPVSLLRHWEASRLLWLGNKDRNSDLCPAGWLSILGLRFSCCAFEKSFFCTNQTFLF